MHERISISSQCFGGAGWRELSESWAVLQPSRVGVLGTLIDHDPAAARQVLCSYRLETIIHPFMLGHQLDAGDEVIAAERLRLSSRLAQAAELGARSVFIASGGRGALTWEQAAEAFAAAIAPCAAAAAAAGVALLIENTPTLYADLNIALSLRDTVTLAEMAGLGVCLDIFSCWSEAGLVQTIKRAAPRLHLIQIADYVLGDRALPGRAVPGDGSVPVRRLIEWCLAVGYEGAFELELLGPRIDAEGHLAATRRAVGQLDALLQSLDG